MANNDDDSFQLTNRKFKDRKAWEIVKDLPNFVNLDVLMQPAKRTKIGANGSYTSNSSNPSNAKSTNEMSSMRSRPLGQKSVKKEKGKKKTVNNDAINSVAQEISMLRQQSNGINFKTAYEIYTRDTNDMSPYVVENHLKVCRMLEKKFDFGF